MATTAQPRIAARRARDRSLPGRRAGSGRHARAALAGALRPGHPDALSGLALSFLLVALAVVVKLALTPVASLSRPFLLLNAAIVAAAWYGGARAGLPAIVLSLGACAFFFLPPEGIAVAGPEDLWALALFAGEALFITGLCEQAREARERAESSAARAARELSERKEAEELARHMEAGMAALGRLGLALGAELEPCQVATVATEGALPLTGARWAALWFRLHEDPRPVLSAASGSPPLAAELPVDMERLLARVENTPALRFAEARLDAGLASLATGPHPVRAAMIARVEGRSGRGILLLAHAEPRAFSDHDERLATLLAVQTAAALDNAHHHAGARSALVAAQEAARVKDEFLSTLSHELRTPINAIVGWAHLLQGRKLGPDDTHRAVETIVRNASLQESMIGELLDMSKLMNGRLQLSSSPVDLQRVVADALGTARDYARAKNVELRLDPASDPVEVRGDAQRLQQVVWSLLSNAVKFTPPGGWVRVGVRAASGAAEVVVSDSGAGMDREFLQRVFERFTRADASSTRPTRGLGLGLSLARGLVELHGGQISADSPGPGLGSTFRVRLPLLTRAESAEPAPAHAVAPRGAA
jgi:signal transduction histidine kinase